MTTELTKAAQQALEACPFCGCDMRIESNRDWHKLHGNHDEGCVFSEDEPVMTVPATDCQLEVLVHDWNTRALTQRPAAQTEREACSDCDGKGYIDSWTVDGEYNPTHCESCDGGRKPAPQQATPEAQEVDWRTPTTYAQRFTEAVALLCREMPPADMVAGWIDRASDDHRLQDWACERAPAWAQGIGLLDAAHVMADQPTEGVDHEPAPQQATPDDSFVVISYRTNDISLEPTKEFQRIDCKVNGIDGTMETRRVDENTVDHGRMVAFADEGATPEPVGEPTFAQLTQILEGLNRCHARDSKAEFLRVWIRDWTQHKLEQANRPAPGVHEGFALVPKKPTPEMVRAGERDRRQSPTNLNPLTTWYAMLAAAQAKGAAHD